MTEMTAYQPTRVSPPGATLADMLEERELTQAEFAVRIGRPIKTVNEIIKGRASITAEIALQLEQALGTPAAFWISREARYREHLARRQADEELLESGSELTALVEENEKLRAELRSEVSKTDEVERSADARERECELSDEDEGSEG